MPDQAILHWARDVVGGLGTQKEAAERTGIPYATLQRILAGTSPLTFERIEKIAEAAGVSAQGSLASILSAEQLETAQGGLSRIASRARQAAAEARSSMMEIPALRVKAAAGDGSIIWGAEVGPGPFLFAEDWLRRSFGTINSLRMVQVSGDSQLPDLSDGDWVAIDTAKTKFENGLAVVRLDDCLMIKRLQREGHFLQLMSRNPIYAPIIIDLSKEQERVQVVGKSVFTFKSL